MTSSTNLRLSKPIFHSQINLKRRSPQKLSFPLVFRDLTKSTPVNFPVIKASSSSPSNSKSSLLKKTCITLTAAAAIFAASSFYLVSKPTVRTPDIISAEEVKLEKDLGRESYDVEGLLSLMEIKFELKKYEEAVEILNRVIEIYPNEPKWQAMRARLLSYSSKSDLAIKAFEEILSKDPDRIDAYHYLVMEYSNSKARLTKLEKRIRQAMERFEKVNKVKEIRDLKVLIAQIRVIEGNTSEAIRICAEVVKDDPEDFRIYMFQVLVYFMMQNVEEVGKQFVEFTRLLPKNHPSIIEVITTRTNKEVISEWRLNKALEWRVIVAYDNMYCYYITFGKLILPAFQKSN